jgi:hypothetical protein
MAEIALEAKRQQAGWGRLGLLALRALGKFLIRHAARQGRPKTSAGDVLTLADLGITDPHLSADAKTVARISQRDFDAYLSSESEPTLKGLIRFADYPREGRPYPAGKPLLNHVSKAQNVEFLTSTVEWYAPPEIFEAMEAQFDLDVASPGANVVPWIPAQRHLTREENGLAMEWGDAFVWGNFPYERSRRASYRWIV